MHAGIRARTLDLKSGRERTRLQAGLANAEVLLTAFRRSHTGTWRAACGAALSGRSSRGTRHR